MIEPNPLSLLNHFSMPISVFNVDPKGRREKYPHGHYEGPSTIKPAMLPKDTRLRLDHNRAPYPNELQDATANSKKASSTARYLIADFNFLTTLCASAWS